jgi:hypothetical protein
MDRSIEAGNRLGLFHQTSAPPPNWKNDRKKLDAAKALDRPNAFWMSRRNPPEVSPKASVRFRYPHPDYHRATRAKDRRFRWRQHAPCRRSRPRPDPPSGRARPQAYPV